MRALHIALGGCSQASHTPASAFHSVQLMELLSYLDPHYSAQRHNHKNLPKNQSSQRQIPDKNGKELLCKDLVHSGSIFLLLHGIIYLPYLWKPGVMMQKYPVSRVFLIYIYCSRAGERKGRRKKLERGNSYFFFETQVMDYRVPRWK